MVGKYLSLLFIIIISACSSSNNVYKVFGANKIKKKDHIKSKVGTAGPTKAGVETIFKDMTESYGLGEVVGTNFYAVDFNNDKWADLVVLPNFYSIPEFYEFDPIHRQFKRIVYEPFAESVKYSFLIFVDINKDGVLDLIGGNLMRKTELTTNPVDIYRGEVRAKKLKYIKIKDPFDMLPHGPSSIAVFDYDLDGELDIYMGNWFKQVGRRKIPMPDTLYKGKGFKFQNISYRLNDEFLTRSQPGNYYNATPTFSVATCDINQDGWPDILTASSAGYHNKLWINRRAEKGNRKFVDFGKQTMFSADDDGKLMPKGGGNTFFASCFDYNNDNIMDVFMGELFHAYDHKTKDRSSILTGSQYKFPYKFLRSEFYYTDAEQDGSRCDRRAVFLDYNIDGRQDILVDNSGYPPQSRLILFKQNDDKSFEDVAPDNGLDLLNPSGTVKIDLNEDGLWDFITGQTNIRNAGIKKRIYVFQNKIKRGNRKSLRFYLQGNKANRDGLGAMVIFRSKFETMRRWISYAHGSFPSQNQSGVIFGMEEGDNPLLVEVRWPYKIINKKGRVSILTKVYTFNRLKLDTHKDITLCEDGRWLEGKKECE